MEKEFPFLWTVRLQVHRSQCSSHSRSLRSDSPKCSEGLCRETASTGLAGGDAGRNPDSFVLFIIFIIVLDVSVLLQYKNSRHASWLPLYTACQSCFTNP